jgi:hypothetical protein
MEMKHIDVYKKVAEFITYDPLTGNIYWTTSPSRKLKPGHLAGGVDSQGYWTIRYKKVVLSAHRLIWMKLYGYLPIQIDHKDGIKSNNALINLREANNSQNGMNKGIQKNNTTGYKGVCLNKSTGRYYAKICVNRVTTHLGYFETALQASEAYQQAQAIYHGEFRSQQ